MKFNREWVINESAGLYFNHGVYEIESPTRVLYYEMSNPNWIHWRIAISLNNTYYYCGCWSSSFTVVDISDCNGIWRCWGGGSLIYYSEAKTYFGECVDNIHYLISSLPDSSFSWSDAYPTTDCMTPKAFPAVDVDAWCSRDNIDPLSYLQVDLGDIFQIESVSTWGRQGQYEQYVSSYNLSYSIDGVTFISDDIPNPLIGNADQTTEQRNNLNSNIIAQYLRFTPITYYDHKSVTHYMSLIYKYNTS